MTADVVVCGAGVGGLAAAHALGALGLSVVVLDRRSAPAEVAKGELLQPEAVRILDSWGLLPALVASGAVPVDRLAIRDPGGAALLDLDYGVLPGTHRRILCTEYATLLRLMAAALGPTVEVRRGVTVRAALRNGAGRVVGVTVAAERGRRHDLPARLVVAADGLSSKLRAAAGLHARYRAYDHRLLAFELAGARWPAEVSAYRTGHGLRLVYPLPGDRVRLYAQVRPEELRAGLLGELASWAHRLVASMPALGPVAPALLAGLASRQVLAVHRLRSRRLAAPGLALVGEAAHAVHPMAAQGMNSSVADAEALAAAVASTQGIDHALQAYDDARLRRLDHIATVSHNAARMLTTTTGAGRRLGRRMMRHTAANPRLLRITAGNLAGVAIRPLTAVDRLYQLGVLTDRRAGRAEHEAAAYGGGVP